MNYASMAKTAKRLIKAMGKPVALTRPIPGVFDPVTGIETGSTTSTVIGSGVDAEFELLTVAQSMALEARKRLLCVGLPTLTPSVDRLTIGGADYLVVKCDPVEPGPVTLLLDVWVR